MIITNVNLLLRKIFCWKFAFYELLLPLLRTLGPSWCDAVLSRLGQTLTLLWPGRRATAARLDQGPRRSRPGRTGQRTAGRIWRPARQGFWPATTPSSGARMSRSSSGSRSRGREISSRAAGGARGDSRGQPPGCLHRGVALAIPQPAAGSCPDPAPAACRARAGTSLMKPEGILLSQICSCTATCRRRTRSI